LVERFWGIGELSGGREIALRDRFAALSLAGVDAPDVYVPMRRAQQWLRKARRFIMSEKVAFSRYVFIHFTNVERQLELFSMPERVMNCRLLRCVEFRDNKRHEEIAALCDEEITRLKAWEASGALEALPDGAEVRFVSGKLLIVQGGFLAGQEVRVAQNAKIGARSVLVEAGTAQVRVPVGDFAPA
jgi:hypothetical protein